MGCWKLMSGTGEDSGAVDRRSLGLMMPVLCSCRVRAERRGLMPLTTYLLVVPPFPSAVGTVSA